jgi:hypothetical protein
LLALRHSAERSLAQQTRRVASVVAGEGAELAERQPALPIAGALVAPRLSLVIACLSRIDRATVAALLAADLPG